MDWSYVIRTALPASCRWGLRCVVGSMLLVVPAVFADVSVMTPAVSSTSQVSSAAAPMALSDAAPAAPARPTIHGWVEWASLEPEDLQLEAKFDTGAETSSLDADNLRLSERDGQEYATFELRASQGGHAVTRTLSYPVTRWVRIRSAAGVDRRPVVRMQVCVGAQTIDAEFSLRDRGDMTYQLLLGRRAIALFGPVDAGHTHLLGTCQLP